MTWWEALHFNLANLVAGFMGGVVNSFVFKRITPMAIVGSVVVGSLTANYLADSAQKLLTTMPYLSGTTEHVAAFLVGLGGMGLVQGIIEGIKKFRPAGVTPERGP